jgi:hypothetical protein
MSELLKNIIRFILFILIQQFVLNQIPPLHQFITPYIYFLYILWLPFNINRIGLMFIAFIFGLTLDYFTHTSGLHAASCVLIAFVRPFLLSLLVPQETTEQSYIEPSTKSMGFLPYSIYVIILTFIHHFYLIFLEWLQIGNFIYFIMKVLSTTAISLLLILLTEMLFVRKARYKTNAA